jgi:hypothetical protein
MLSDACNRDQFHELYLQRNGEQYFYPIIYQHGMDQRECDLYYNVLNAQQHGGLFRQPRDYYKPISCQSSVKSAPISILRNKKTQAKRTEVRSRPALIRRVSFSDQLLGKEQNTFNVKLSRPSSSRIIDRPRVAFAQQVLVTTIYPIVDMPLEVRSNVWMSRDELLICMHDAAIEQMEERMASEKEEKLRSSLERRTSCTSVVDSNEGYISDAIAAPFLL